MTSNLQSAMFPKWGIRMQCLSAIQVLQTINKLPKLWPLNLIASIIPG